MKKDNLIKSAKRIKPLSEKALQEFDNNMDGIILEMNLRMQKREDLLDLIGGQDNLSMMKDNHDNHLRFIRSTLEYPDAEILVDTVLWVFRAYMSRGFHTNYWSAQINTWIHVMEEMLTPGTMSEIIPLYNWMSNNIPIFTIAYDEKLEKSVHETH